MSIYTASLAHSVSRQRAQQRCSAYASGCFRGRLSCAHSESCHIASFSRVTPRYCDTFANVVNSSIARAIMDIHVASLGQCRHWRLEQSTVSIYTAGARSRGFASAGSAALLCSCFCRVYARAVSAVHIAECSEQERCRVKSRPH